MVNHPKGSDFSVLPWTQHEDEAGWEHKGLCPSPGSLCPVLPSFPTQSLHSLAVLAGWQLLSEGCFHLLTVCLEEEECDQGNMLYTGQEAGPVVMNSFLSLSVASVFYSFSPNSSFFLIVCF